MKKRTIILLLLVVITFVLVLIRLLFNTNEKLFLTYILSLDSETPAEALVELEAALPNQERDQIIELSVPMQDQYVQIRDVTLDSGKLEMEVNDTDAKNHRWTTTKYSIRPPENRFTLKYRPQIGIREGSHHTGFSGFKFGFVNNDFGIASGYNLFLFPTNGIDDADEIRVKIINNTGQPVYVPWQKQNDYYYPSIKGKYKIETLLKSSIVWGDFSRTQLTFESDVFEIFISNLIAEELRKDILDKTAIILANLTRIFGKTGLDKIDIYLLPKTTDGYNIFTKNWSNQIALTMYPPTNSRWKKFTTQVLNVYLQHDPTRNDIYKKEDYWLIDGLKYYYADKSLDWIKRSNFSELVSSYETKMMSRMNSQHETTLSELFGKKFNLPELTNYKMKSTYVLNKINDIIVKASNQKDGLDIFLPYYFKKNDRHNFTELVSKYLGSRMPQEELQKYVAQKIFQNDFPVLELNILSNQKDKIPSNNSYTKKLKLLHIAEHYNYLENCGCKANQNGGLARLATVIEEKRGRDPELILLNLGDNIPIEKHEMELKEFTKKEVLAGFGILNQIQFDAINVSFTEMLYTPEYLLSLLDDIPLPYINSNIRLKGKAILPSYKIISKQGMKIGVFGISNDQYHGKQLQIFEDNIYFSEYENSEMIIRSVVDTLRSYEKVDLVIMMCNLERPELEEMISDQNIDLILTSQSLDRQHLHEFGQTFFLDSTLVIRSDLGSYGLIETDVYLKGNRIVSASSQAIQLDESVADDAKTRQFLNDFYLSIAHSVKNLRKVHLWEEHLDKEEFVGAENCKNCHSLQYNQWRNTAHATAFATLTKRHRNYFPNCVQCHVTAFEFTPGFGMGEINNREFQNVQCEMCHGPGSLHIKNPISNSLLKTPSYRDCIQCHDNKHSNLTKSNFDEYYQKVIH